MKARLWPTLCWAALLTLALTPLGWAGISQACLCPYPGDPNNDGMIDVIDVIAAMNRAFSGDSCFKDIDCPAERCDFNADGVTDVHDLVDFVDLVFYGGTLPPDPCVGSAPPPAPTSGGAVIVESKQMALGATGQTIAVRLSNTVAIQELVVPLILREVTSGCFISSLQLGFAERLTSNLTDISKRNQYVLQDGACLTGYPGGFATIAFSDGAAHAVSSSPIGALYVRGGFFSSLSPGSDVSGSLVLTVDAGTTSGQFEIDTTCTNPGNHLLFIQASTKTPYLPSFTKGVIEVGTPRAVTSLLNSGLGTLRDAIDSANATPGPDAITFQVGGVIQLLSPLPALSDASGGTRILGFTAPGASPPNIPNIVLDGTNSLPGPLLLVSSSNNRIEGMVIHDAKGPAIAVVGGSSSGNTITDCRFFHNTGPAIDLGNNGITANDPGDTDTGPNGLLNFPEFDSVLQAGPNEFGVYGHASPSSQIELFLAAQADDPLYVPEMTNNGPAYLLLAWTMSAADSSFSFPSLMLPEWSLVTATVTDGSGNTSELAENRALTPDPLRVTAYSEQIPPARTAEVLPQTSPAIQVVVISPPNSIGIVDSIGPDFNTFGSRATYDSLTDENSGGLPDTRVKIVSPDSGEYRVKYILIGDPGTYLTGIGIDGHAELKKNVAFGIVGEIDSTSFRLSLPSRGELTGDGIFDVFDVISLIDIVFSGAPMPDPPELVDLNCDLVPDVFDIIYLIDYVFSGGQAPCL